MKPDDFEAQVQRQALRSIPTEWRAEILQAAKAGHEISATQAAPRSREEAARMVIPWWQRWLWPCPQAWVGLAGVWLAILALQWGSTESGPVMTAQEKLQPSPSLLQMVKEQRQLLASVAAPWDAPAAEPPKPSQPKPKSARQLNWSLA
jgi:hypothetical protein